MKIFWTKRAEKRFSGIVDYLRNEWGGKVKDAFVQKTDDFLKLLERFPEIGSVEVEEKNIRGYTLTKHNRVFYRIKKDKIILLTFFDTRQNPKRKPR